MIDGVSHQSDSNTEISKRWHVSFRWCKIYNVKNSSVNSVIIYIHMNIFENEFLDFPSLINNYLQPLIFR